MGVFNIDFLILFLMLSSSCSQDREICKSPQYHEIGKEGVVECNFQDGFYAAVWYTSEGLEKRKPLLRLIDGVKTGDGLTNGEFDIRSDGSLIIRNVTIQHDRNFTLVKFQSEGDDPIFFSVEVIILVKPPSRQPLIKGCASTSTACFSIIATEVVCFVQNARPPVTLEWILWTPDGGRNLSSDVTVEQNGVTSTTIVTTREVFYFTSVLSLLVCKAHSLRQMLDNDETSILIEKNDTDFSSLTPVPKFIERNSKLELLCSETHINLIVWKKLSKFHDHFEPILYAALFDETVSMTNYDSYELNPDGSLMVTHTEVKHEGFYGCAYETNFTGDRALFNVTIFVPAYSNVTGCNKYQYCILETGSEGSITCSVTGIRPLVQLEVGTLNEHDSSFITFTDREVTVNNDGDVYDIRMTLKYQVQETFQERLTLECRVSGTNIEILKSTTKFDLLLSKVKQAEPTKKPVSSSFLWILLILIPLSILIIVFGRYALRKGTGPERQNETNEEPHNDENMPMIPTCSSEKPFEAKSMFLRELIQKYDNLYNAVRPIPYIRDRLFCVDKVFVEGGIEYLIVNDKTKRDGTWVQLHSYKDLFNNVHVQNVRRILEGEPGFGKSTVTLQIAYDWCNGTANSVSDKYEILIVLRLKQLGGVKSIFKAVEQFILPADSSLNAADIQKILKESNSVLVILDGFDEYPDRDSDTTSDVRSIIKKEMFQTFDVVLMTRTACLPKDPAPQTQRIRLTGFDENARDEYIRKAVVGDDGAEAAVTIKRRLQANPILADLCQVPLFFVMFAHMSHESEHVKKFNSVTSFFRYMIWCVHHHMKNKMKDDNVQKYSLFEEDHRELDKIAFEGLIGKDQQLIWGKEELCGRLGKDFYDHYVRLGILVEEDVLDITSTLDSPVFSNLVQEKTEVRFYHKLFCEWYAAQYISTYAGRGHVRFMGTDRWHKKLFHKILGREDISSILQELDPFDLQYVFRFACGLNKNASEKIIEYLKNKENASNFAVLCIFEKEGNIETILDSVRDICSKTISIRNDDTLLLQRSTIQLLDVAATNDISISCVYLINCYSTVYLSGGYHLQLKSNLNIPVLTTLNTLEIDEKGRDITEEFTDILQYSSKCLALKKLVFGLCLLPQSVQDETVSVLRSRNVKVIWVTPNFNQYHLNLQSCLWERIGMNGRVIGVMTNDDYQREVKRFRAKHGIRN